MNRYIAIGNLTHNPECKDIGDTKVCKFSIAVNEYYYSANGEKKKTTLFLDIETWSKQAENCTKFLSKGKKVAIEGKLKTNNWEKNGQKFSKIYCLADKVHFLASEDAPQSRNSEKPSLKEVKNIEEKLENPGVDVDDIDDIPF
jgi:single-strand DNA-binding protein